MSNATLTPPPFGLILPARPVLTAPIAISPTQFAFTFPSTPSFSHIIVFLLPSTTLPDGTLAGVYIQLPNSAPEFKLLGALGVNKQSAIFKINADSAATNATDIPTGTSEDEMTDVDAANGAASIGEVAVGISIEPAANISTQLETLKSAQSSSSTALVTSRSPHQRPSPLTTKVLAQRIIKNAFNFLASFAGTTGVGGQEVIPLKSFQDWWAKFERRIENDPGFLEKEADS